MSHRRRIDLLTGGGLAILLGLGGRLYALSVLRHDELRDAAERRSRRAIVLPARRAPILDRDRVPLALDLPVRSIVLDLTDLDPTLGLIPQLGWCLRIDRLQAAERLARARALAAERVGADGEGEVVLGRVSLEEAERIERLLRRATHLRAEPRPDGLRLVVPADVLRVRTERLARVARLLDLDAAELEARFEARVREVHALEERDERLIAWRKRLVVVERASFAQVARVTERAFELRGVEVREGFERVYPQGDVASHLVGYVGPPTAAEEREALREGLLLDSDRELRRFLSGERDAVDPRMRLRDERYGRRGLELSQEERLRGVPGLRVEVRDVKGRVRDELLHLPPKDGETLQLTLDVDVQRAAEAALDRAVARHGDPAAGGAAVLIDLSDGGVIALASAPRFAAATLNEDYRGLVADPRKPLLHRAVLPQAPGSTFKVLSAFAIVDRSEEGGLPLDWTTVCTGRLTSREAKVGGRCDGVHGTTGLARSLERSCNVFYYRAADRVGLAPIARWARRVGLDGPLGIDVPGERGGTIPAPGYKEARLAAQEESVASWARRLAEACAHGPAVGGEAVRRVAHAADRLTHATVWRARFAADLALRPGEVRNTAIGQGDVRLTPLQVASLAALVATAGDMPLPRLAADAPPAVRHVPLDPAALALVADGMRRVVTRGTASAARIGLRDLDVAGKTGTAERRKGEPHLAWFMGYYPASAPEVAFAVLVDRTSQHGGEVCGPVTRALLEAYEAARGGRLR